MALRHNCPNIWLDGPTNNDFNQKQNYGRRREQIFRLIKGKWEELDG